MEKSSGPHLNTHDRISHQSTRRLRIKYSYIKSFGIFLFTIIIAVFVLRFWLIKSIKIDKVIRTDNTDKIKIIPVTIIPTPTSKPGYKNYIDQELHFGLVYPESMKLKTNSSGKTSADEVPVNIYRLYSEKNTPISKEELSKSMYPPCGMKRPEEYMDCKIKTVEEFTNNNGYKGYIIHREITVNKTPGENEAYEDSVYVYPLEAPIDLHTNGVVLLTENKSYVDELTTIAETFYIYK